MLSCSYCGKTNTKIVKTLCVPCYYRQKKNGSPEYLRKGTSTKCTVEGCDNRSHGKGLCAMHTNRLRRHGHLEQTRPEDWGMKNDHPLTSQWNYLHHKKGVHLCAPEWRTDFRRFVADVGAQPSPKHRLKPRDSARLIGPDNFVWSAPSFERLPEETKQEAANRAERGRRAEDPDKFRNTSLRKKFAGLTHENVSAMSNKQNHCCAICGEKEGTIIRDKVIALAVDHIHGTDIIRGLLCVKCNRGLGLFRDNPAFLASAIAYLANPPGEAEPRGVIKRRAPRTTPMND